MEQSPQNYDANFIKKTITSFLHDLIEEEYIIKTNYINSNIHDFIETWAEMFCIDAGFEEDDDYVD